MRANIILGLAVLALVLSPVAAVAYTDWRICVVGWISAAVFFALSVRAGQLEMARRQLDVLRARRRYGSDD